jgi:GNAT superfamily N-acetyltransferase
VIDQKTRVVIRRFDAARDTASLQECVIDQQNVHRNIEPSWPDGDAIVGAYVTYLETECAAHNGCILMAQCGKLRSVDDDRTVFVPLLLEADESEPVVRAYLNDGDLLEFVATGQPVGVVLLTFPEPATVEIRNIAIRREYRGQGTGRAEITSVAARAKETGSRPRRGGHGGFEQPNDRLLPSVRLPRRRTHRRVF